MTNNFKKVIIFIFIFFSVSISSFLYGLASFKYQLPPFKTLYYLWSNLVVHKQKQELRRSSNKLEFNGDFSSIHKKIKLVKNNSELIRQSLIKNVILPKAIFKVSKQKIYKQNYKKFTFPLYGHDNYEVTSKFYNINIKGVLQKSKINNEKCLLIYFEGHEGHPFYIKTHDKLSKYTISNNCDILTFSMLGLGLNNNNIISFPSTVNKNLKLNRINATNHGNYAFYYDENFPKYDPISLFLSGHYYIIKQIINDYKEISAFGFSGGGWYATWFGAIFPELDKTIAYSGSMPLGYLQKKKNHGDWEQTYSTIYKKFNYWTLYTLGTVNQKSKPNRKKYLVYNDYDDICFTGEDIVHLKKILNELNFKDLKVIIINNDKHSVILKPILKLLDFN